MGCVYVATCTVNGKKYIGKTVKSLSARRKSHENHAINGQQFVFQKALNKYGTHSFKWKALFVSENDKELCRMEMFYIAKFKCKCPKGYNLTDGGDGFVGHFRTPEHNIKIGLSHIGIKHSAIARLKISLAHKGKPSWNKGKSLSPEHRANLSRARTGMKQSEETKKKLAILFKGRTSPNKGKVMKEATKEKLSQALKGIKKGPFSTEHRKRMSESMLASKCHAGAKNGNAKLNKEIVSQIRKLYVKGSKEFGSYGLAKLFGLRQGTIHRIVTKPHWSDND